MAVIALQPKRAAQAQPSFAALARQLKVLGDPTRLAIVALLSRQEYCVCDMMATPQSTCSHHLGVLKCAWLVRDRRDAKDAHWAYYTLDPNAIATLREQVGTVLDLAAFDPTPANCE